MRRFISLFLLSCSALAALAQTTPTARYATVADMIAARIPAVPAGASGNISALVTGRVTANDGGGGLFFFTPASVTATNLGTVFPSTGVAGRWFRQYSGALNARWFGATGDGSSDDTPALTDSIATAFVGSGSVFVPFGRYSITSITLPQTNMTLFGSVSQSEQSGSLSSNRTVLVARSSATVLNIPGSGNVISARVADLSVDGNSLALTGIAASGTFILDDVAVLNCVDQGILASSLNSAVFNRVSCTRNENGLVVTNNASPVSTKYSINSSTFSLNTSVGAIFMSGRNVTIRDTLFESNTTNNGVRIIKPASELNSCNFFRFQSCWWEENGVNTLNSTNSYQLVIDAEDGSNRPTYLTFDGCLFSASGNRGCVNVVKGLQSRFENCQFQSAANATTMGASGSDFSFFNCTGVAALTGRNFEWGYNNTASTGGFDFNSPIVANTFGVGTLTPTSGLTLRGNSNTDITQEILFEDTYGNAHTWRFGPGVTASNTFGLRIPTAGTNAITVNGLGNIGFGDLVPSSKLSLKGDSSISGADIAIWNTAVGGSIWRLGDGVTGVPGTFALRDTGVGQNRVFVNSIGQVGIGATPGTILDLIGNSTTLGADIGIENLAGGGKRWRFGELSTIGSIFLRNITDGITAIAITGATGNVGIGDTTPASLLTVGNGELFQVNSSGAVISHAGITGGGNITIELAGNGIKIKEGSNARMGRTALVNGTATVANTSVTASTEIFLTRRIQTGTTVGILSVGTVTAATSFVINSLDLAGALSADDDSTVNWLLVEPSP